MITPRANVHHSRLPAPGTVGRIVGLSTVNPRRKCIVVAYPLCDNTRPYSIGIHTCWVRFLDNGNLQRFSGIWFQADADAPTRRRATKTSPLIPQHLSLV